MGHVRYFKIADGGQTQEEIDAIIASLDAIIQELLKTALRGVTQADIAEYDIETGQTVQRVKYSSQETLLKSIEGYKRLRQLYANRTLNRKIKLVDSKVFIRKSRR